MLHLILNHSDRNTKKKKKKKQKTKTTLRSEPSERYALLPEQRMSESAGVKDTAADISVFDKAHFRNSFAVKQCAKVVVKQKYKHRLITKHN